MTAFFILCRVSYKLWEGLLSVLAIPSGFLAERSSCLSACVCIIELG